MGFVKENNDPYKFDLDLNNVLALTEDNVKRIRFLIDNDSRYPDNSEEESKIVEELRENNWEMDEFPDKPQDDPIYRLVESIDRANSTHQSSRGPHSSVDDNDNGRTDTAKYIRKIKNLKERLEKSDPTLVDDIASYSIKGRYTFSFASKFCTFTARLLSPESDGYSIYDQVVRMALPYYSCVYLGEELSMWGDRCIRDPYSKFGDKKFKNEDEWKYKRYSDLIGEIIKANKMKTGYKISRENFDNLLWYYFKSERSRIEKTRDRISKANLKASRDNFINSANYGD